MTISRTVPNIRSDRPAETLDFFVELLGFDVAMDMGWVVTVASPTNPSAHGKEKSRRGVDVSGRAFRWCFPWR
jgi:hypothetical protein